MRIGGKQLYTALVKERFLKLDSSHIEYVLDCLREIENEIDDAMRRRPETL